MNMGALPGATVRVVLHPGAGDFAVAVKAIGQVGRDVPACRIQS